MKWEYHFFLVAIDREDQVILDELNKLGKNGWELVGVYEAAFRVFILKRPAVPSQ